MFVFYSCCDKANFTIFNSYRTFFATPTFLFIIFMAMLESKVTLSAAKVSSSSEKLLTLDFLSSLHKEDELLIEELIKIQLLTVLGE